MSTGPGNINGSVVRDHRVRQASGTDNDPATVNEDPGRVQQAVLKRLQVKIVEPGYTVTVEGAIGKTQIFGRLIKKSFGFDTENT
jgi:hypothetical protein